MIKQDCPPHRYVNGRCVNRAARTDGNPEGITCHAREPVSGGGRHESVVREVENIALAKLRLAKGTNMNCTLTSAEVRALLDMLRSG